MVRPPLARLMPALLWKQPPPLLLAAPAKDPPQLPLQCFHKQSPLLLRRWTSNKQRRRVWTSGPGSMDIGRLGWATGARRGRALVDCCGGCGCGCLARARCARACSARMGARCMLSHARSLRSLVPRLVSELTLAALVVAIPTHARFARFAYGRGCPFPAAR